MNLFCIPYAGGHAQAYKSWRKYLDNRINLIPIELAGHGSRIGEPLYSDFYEAIDDIYAKICSYDLDDYIIFGHSMGACFAYEVALKLASQCDKMPKKIIVSGSFPPHVLSDKVLHDLPMDEFMNELYQLGGMPQEIIEIPELFKTFSPIIYNDVKILEEYKEKQDDKIITKVNVDIDVFSGDEDDFKFETLKTWNQYTSKKCFYSVFLGNHFYLFKRQEEVCGVINLNI